MTDTRYELQIDGTNAKLEWAGSVVSHRRACQTLFDQNRALISDAQKLEGPAKMSATEATRLPKLGVCQPAGGPPLDVPQRARRASAFS
ncbi:hypothetical protein WMF26_31735 [Sorangium sp. So ce185]|uniref:hypothetical protein n=1 Tax=Sorangium sp. So ce185 TaxID=3133287 RepID=UPI003F625793